MVPGYVIQVLLLITVCGSYWIHRLSTKSHPYLLAENCVLSSWSEWSSCSQTCVRPEICRDGDPLIPYAPRPFPHCHNKGTLHKRRWPDISCCDCARLLTWLPMFLHGPAASCNKASNMMIYRPCPPRELPLRKRSRTILKEKRFGGECQVAASNNNQLFCIYI